MLSDCEIGVLYGTCFVYPVPLIGELEGGGTLPNRPICCYAVEGSCFLVMPFAPNQNPDIKKLGDSILVEGESTLALALVIPGLPSCSFQRY